ncbi:acid protease, partial [Hysterangium stoloniferum]
VQAGDNQTFTKVLVDTGSSVLWVGAQEPYKPGLGTQDLNQTFSVGYGIGSARGAAYYDTVQIGGAIATSQIIGAANETVGFDLNRPFDGILGLGPSKSNKGEVSGFQTTPTFVETLFAQGKIQQPVFGLYMQPLDNAGTADGSGEISFGGADMNHINGDITWIPQNPPLNLHWEFNISGMTFGSVVSNVKAYGRTDSGVLGLEIPTDEFFSILHSYNGTLDTTPGFEGFLSFPPNSSSTLPSLTITINNTEFTITPSQYLISPELYPRLNMTANVLHTWICPAGPNAFNLGQKFLEKVYTVYDSEWRVFIWVFFVVLILVYKKVANNRESWDNDKNSAFLAYVTGTSGVGFAHTRDSV